MTILRMDHVGVVVDDLDKAVDFFVEIGLEVLGDGPTPVEGAWVDRVAGLRNVRVETVVVQTPDGLDRLELTKFYTPQAIRVRSTAPNAIGLRRLRFAVDDLDDLVDRLWNKGFDLLGEVAPYDDAYRLCYVRGPEDIIVALAEPLR